jgi:hypothetical protein
MVWVFLVFSFFHFFIFYKKNSKSGDFLLLKKKQSSGKVVQILGGINNILNVFMGTGFYQTTISLE